MARRKLPMPCAMAIRELAASDGRLVVREMPKASADAIPLPPDPDASGLLALSTATPERGKANEAILKLLTDARQCTGPAGLGARYAARRKPANQARSYRDGAAMTTPC